MQHPAGWVLLGCVWFGEVCTLRRKVDPCSLRSRSTCRCRGPGCHALPCRQDRDDLTEASDASPQARELKLMSTPAFPVWPPAREKQA